MHGAGSSGWASLRECEFWRNYLVFCPNSSVEFWLRLFVPCFNHFFARCAASNSKIASPDPKIHYPKFNELLVQNTKASLIEQDLQPLKEGLHMPRAV